MFGGKCPMVFGRLSLEDQIGLSCLSVIDEGGMEAGTGSGSPGKKSPLEANAPEVTRVSTPTALETLLPWKRTDDSDSTTAVKQSEFPPWCSNKEYMAYNSPSATFLGGIEQPNVASVIGLFRRDSEPSSPKSSSPTILLIEEATSLLSPRSKAAARRGSLLELSASSVDPIQEEELLTVSNGGSTPSLSDRWTLPRRRKTSQAHPHPLTPSVESLESTESGEEE
ncbi:sodium:proton antiporter activity protein [Homalodisca vitripennis]|nr:sodium:proton antiporter activity protein [Homalodisca vitripennis]